MSAGNANGISSSRRFGRWDAPAEVSGLRRSSQPATFTHPVVTVSTTLGTLDSATVREAHGKRVLASLRRPARGPIPKGLALIELLFEVHRHRGRLHRPHIPSVCRPYPGRLSPDAGGAGSGASTAP